MPLPLPPRKNERLPRRFLAPLCPPAPPPPHPDDAIMRSTGRKEDRWRRGSRLDEVPMSHAVFRLPPPTHLTEPPPPGPIAAPRRSSPATTPPHLYHTARPRRCALPTLPPCRTIRFRASPFVPRCCASPATFTTAAPYLKTMRSMTGLLQWSRQSACSEGGRAHEGRWWQVLATCMPGATWIRVWHATAPVHHERRRRDGRCAPLPEPAPGHPIPFYSPTPTTLPATQHHLPLTNFGEAISCCLPLRSCMPGLLAAAQGVRQNAQAETQGNQRVSERTMVGWFDCCALPTSTAAWFSLRSDVFIYLHCLVCLVQYIDLSIAQHLFVN